jgi:hypothetical protein
MKSVSEQEQIRKDAAEIYRLADAVVRRYRRRDAPGDAEDWRQEAALAILEGVRLRGRPLSDGGYHFEAARLTVALAISRAVAVVHLSEHAAERGLGRKLQDRVPLVGCGPVSPHPRHGDAVELPDRRSPAGRIRMVERGRARGELLAYLAARAARMERPRDRALVTLMLGARGAEPMEPGEAAWAVGADASVAHNAAKRFAQEVAGDRRARRLRRRERVMEEA